MTNIGKPQRVIEIPDPVPVPDYVPEEEPQRMPDRERLPA
jgi:hypothetical protein